jgi:hypothetical protein
MRDNELIRLIISIINSGLLLRGVSGIQVLQAYQPTQQGIIETPVVLISKMDDVPRLWPERTDNWDPLLEIESHSELQIYETHFQIGALYPQNPAVDSMTASDLANTVRQIVQSEDCITTLLENDVQIIRVTPIRNPYFKDDRDLFEMSPSFDIALNHKQEFTNESNAVSLINAGIYRV